MGKQGKKNKHVDQRKHAIRRCNLRLGIRLTDREYDQIIEDINNNDAKFHSKQSNRVSRYKTTIHGHEVLAVYDKFRKTIVTFLVVETDPLLKDIFGWKDYS